METFKTKNSNENECEFCKAYTTDKRYDRIAKHYNGVKLKKEYTVALVSRSWINSKRNFSRIVDFRNKGIGYKLNYCPECGKRLKRGGKS